MESLPNKALSFVVKPKMTELCQDMMSWQQQKFSGQNFSDLEFVLDPLEILEIDTCLGEILMHDEMEFNIMLGTIASELMSDTLDAMVAAFPGSDDQNQIEKLRRHNFFFRAFLTNGFSIELERNLFNGFPVLITGSIISLGPLTTSVHALTFTCGHRHVDKIHINTAAEQTPTHCTMCGSAYEETQSQREMILQCCVLVQDDYGKPYEVIIKGDQLRQDYSELLGSKIVCTGRLSQSSQKCENGDALDVKIESHYLISISAVDTDTELSESSVMNELQAFSGRSDELRSIGHDTSARPEDGFQRLYETVNRVSAEAQLENHCHWSLILYCLITLVGSGNDKGISILVIDSDAVTDRVLGVCATLAPYQIVHQSWNPIGPAMRSKSAWTDAGSLLLASEGLLRISGINIMSPSEWSLLKQSITQGTVVQKITFCADLQKQRCQVIERKTSAIVWASINHDQMKKNEISKCFDILYKMPPANSIDDETIAQSLLDSLSGNGNGTSLDTFITVQNMITDARIRNRYVKISEAARKLLQGYFVVSFSAGICMMAFSAVVAECSFTFSAVAVPFGLFVVGTLYLTMELQSLS